MSRRRAVLCSLAALAIASGVGACGDGDAPAGSGGSGTAIEADPDNHAIELTVGSRRSDEQLILGEIYAQALEAAGYAVDRELELGSERSAFRALEAGDVDGYPEYAETALTAFLGFAPEDVPGDPQQAYQDSLDDFEQEGLVAFAPTPFSTAPAVGALATTAEELGVSTISGLAGISEELSLAGPPDCRRRVGCLKGLADYYRLRFGSFKPIPFERRYDVLDSGATDLSMVLTTDGQLAASEDYALFEDDEGLLPAGNVLFVAGREAVDRAGPDLQATIERVQESLTVEVMQELNARVSLDREEPKAVAADYLREAGYVQ